MPSYDDDWKRRVDASPALCLAYVREHATEGDPQSVLTAIEDFARKHTMINVGERKGAVVDEQIRKIQPRVMVELGAYSGYSAVRFANLQREVSGPESHYYSFEYSPEFAEIVKEMVAFAGLANHVTVITGAFADEHKTLSGKIVDMFFIDHEKTCYLPDAKLIIAGGTLRKGSLLVADNVLVPGAPDYLAFINAHPQFSTTQTEIEFVSRAGEPIVDAIHVAEFLG